jgi:hypothetical protein
MLGTGSRRGGRRGGRDFVPISITYHQEVVNPPQKGGVAARDDYLVVSPPISGDLTSFSFK